MIQLTELVANEHREDLIRAARRDSLSRAARAGAGRRKRAVWPWSHGSRQSRQPCDATALAARHEH